MPEYYLVKMEHVNHRSSWKNLEKQGAIRVSGLTYKEDATSKNKQTYIRRRTDFMTNSKQIADVIRNFVHDNKGTEFWMESTIQGGPLELQPVLPLGLVCKILGALECELSDSGYVMSLGGEVPELPDVPENWRDLVEEDGEYWDDVRGGRLDTKLVQAARREEIDWLRKEKVYEIIPRSQAIEEGITPIKLLWINTNTGTEDVPNYRSRVVVRERKVSYSGHSTKVLPAAQLFSAMPPLESLKLLASLLMSLKTSVRGKPLKVDAYRYLESSLHGNSTANCLH